MLSGSGSIVIRSNKPDIAPSVRSSASCRIVERYRIPAARHSAYQVCIWPSGWHLWDLLRIFPGMSMRPQTREAAIERLQAIEAQIRHLGVRRLALFGSVLRNEARADSDVDVLVEFIPAQKSFDRFMALADLLEETLGHRVEIVTTEALSPFIGPHILAEATDVLRAA